MNEKMNAGNARSEDNRYSEGIRINDPWKRVDGMTSINDSENSIEPHGLTPGYQVDGEGINILMNTEANESSLPPLELVLNTYKQRLILEGNFNEQVSEKALAKMDELIEKGHKAIESGDEDAIRYARVELFLHAFESGINAYKDDGITTSGLEDYVKLAMEQEEYLMNHNGTEEQIREATRRMENYSKDFNIPLG